MDTISPMNQNQVEQQAPAKKRGRPSKVDKFRQQVLKAYQNNTCPRYINERIIEFNKQLDLNAYYLSGEWRV